MDRRVDTNGVRLHVVDEGEGAPVLFLNGFPDSVELWSAQRQAVVAAGYRAISLELRGYGASDKPQSPDDYVLPLALLDVAGVLDALEVDRAAVVSHDWGAAVGSGLSAFAPERVERLVAISVGHPDAFFTAGGVEQRERSWYMLFFQSPEAEQWLRHDGWSGLRALFCDRDWDRFPHNLDEPGALVAALNWYRANAGAAFFGATEPLGLPATQCPTLAIWSDGDVHLGEAQMRGSEQFVGGEFRYERIEGVGHWIPYDAADRLNELLLEFLSG
ncbi:MAG: alpha/beta fold hydrolase [Acidimicrobiia bacterium]